MRQFDRLGTLEKSMPSCRIVGYRRWDDSHISPLVAMPGGDTIELRPNGRLHRDREVA